jgi:microcompartment protein CcmL/EutN
MDEPALGLLELYSVARGMQAADAGNKAAAVRLIFARPFCAGKFAILWAGDVAEVKSALAAGRQVGSHLVVDETLLPAAHPSLIPALGGANPYPPGAALGIVETYSIAGTLGAADAAAKAARVEVVEMRVAIGLGGRGYFSVAGEVAAVSQAVEVARAYVVELGLLVDAQVIPAPDPQLIRRLGLLEG